MGVNLFTVKTRFAKIMEDVEASVAAQFIVWLDQRVAEFKVNGDMTFINLHVDGTAPRWIKNFNISVLLGGGNVVGDEEMASITSKTTYKTPQDSTAEIESALDEIDRVRHAMDTQGDLHNMTSYVSRLKQRKLHKPSLDSTNKSFITAPGSMSSIEGTPSFFSTPNASSSHKMSVDITGQSVGDVSMPSSNDNTFYSSQDQGNLLGNIGGGDGEHELNAVNSNKDDIINNKSNIGNLSPGSDDKDGGSDDMADVKPNVADISFGSDDEEVAAEMDKNAEDDTDAGSASTSLHEMYGAFLKNMYATCQEGATPSYEPQMYRCLECNYETLSGTEFEQHRETVHSSNMDKSMRLCPICGLICTSRANLRAHYKLEHLQEALPCPHCDKTFRSKFGWTKHIESKHGVGGKHECPECGRKFTSKQHFESHVASHTGFRPHVCELCGQAFRYKHTLKEHIKKRCNKTPMVSLQEWVDCDICGKTFAEKRLLGMHMKGMHSSEPQYTCPGCKKPFRWNTSFRIHKEKCAALKEQSTASSSMNTEAGSSSVADTINVQESTNQPEEAAFTALIQEAINSHEGST